MAGCRFEAVVIGGGPAGAAAACGLADAGLRVALIERRRPGQTKACGHCMSPRAMDSLSRLRLSRCVRRVAVGEYTGAMLNLGRGARIELETPSAPGLLTPRSILDEALRDEAEARGVVVHRECAAEIVSLETRNPRVRVRRLGRADAHGDLCQEFECDLVIGADGLNSRVARASDLPWSSRGGMRGFSFELDGDDVAWRFDAGMIHMFFSARKGYLGIAREGASRLHIGGLINASGGRGGDIGSFMASMMREHEDLREAFSGWTLRNARSTLAACGPMPMVRRRIATSGVALVGDAAGYGEPFSGEGMTWAFESAALLVETIRSHRCRWSVAAADAYDAAWRATIGARVCGVKLLGTVLRRAPAAGRLLARSGIGRSAVRRIARSALQGARREVRSPAPLLHGTSS